jgi:hypothetical protein
VIAAEMADVARRDLRHADGMDEKAIRRAALITVHRAIYQRFPPGPERDQWLAWLGAVRDSTARRAPRPWPGHRYYFGRLFPALRAAHPLRKRLERR